MEDLSLVKIHRKYIKSTEKQGIVALLTLSLCSITEAVNKCLNYASKNVYVTTRTLKHLYDKRPAEEYDFFLYNAIAIIRFPERIYKNKQGKRGDYCFVSKVKNRLFFTSFEFVNEGIYVVTSFTIEEDYLKGYELVWSWRIGEPSS